MGKNVNNILDLNNNEARGFFLNEEKYTTLDLPKYFVFTWILKKTYKIIKELYARNIYDKLIFLVDSSGKKLLPQNYDDINYKLFNNKDWEYSWRMLQLIHPVIYVSLVCRITDRDNWNIILERFSFFKNNNIVECVSIPVAKGKNKKTTKGSQILSWWQEVEQRSISLALEYDYVFHTDIIDCYWSIYTHSVSWALHTKHIAKSNRRSDKFLGNIIDKHLQQMANGQTNGIPQGSTLMDFIAEMVLGYVDEELTRVIKWEIKEEFKIIRYRDDYRIFVNSPEIGKKIIKELTNVLSVLWMRISLEKTIFSSDVIGSSIKEDKFFWLMNNSKNRDIWKNLLILKRLSEKYPNSWTLQKELESFYWRILRVNKFKNVEVLVSIITDIAFRNPRTYPISVSILGKFISTLKDDKKKMRLIKKIENKIKKLPNTEMLDLWLQRLTIRFDRFISYQWNLSKRVNNNSEIIWNSDWLNKKIKNELDSVKIVNGDFINEMDEFPNRDEIFLFKKNTHSL